ncbi:MAG TPA: thiol:disulfide interchange protein DsbA/DsbL [Rhodanobacteraceae bacterium]|jgi:thiol:disulfide interchange protein DsbA|nr:thiol:disulfide interchange protein DsbA/DsbL [Rhodanobacteraceae bacterium]
MLTRLGILLAGLVATSAAVAADAPAAPAAAAATNWVEGTQYFLIDPPQPTASGDKVEVLEIFSYACPHCAHFQPYAEQLKQSLPAGAVFGYMPAVFNATWEPYARAYYTAESLGVVDQTHQALFDALHRDHLPMRTIEDLASFYAEHGVDKAKFLTASGSFEVESKLSRSQQIVKAEAIDGTPSIVVDGKYRATGQSAGGYSQLIELVDWLVKKELDAKAKPAKKKK